MEIQREKWWVIFGRKSVSWCAGVLFVVKELRFCLVFSVSPSLHHFSSHFPAPCCFCSLCCDPILPPFSLLAGPLAVQSVGVGVGELSRPLPCGATLCEPGGFRCSGQGVGHRGGLELLLW